MEAILSVVEVFLPGWMLKLPKHIQSTIVLLVAVHVFALLGVIFYVVSGAHSRSGKADFKAKLK